MNCQCGYVTENRKSFSNHIRYGCRKEQGVIMTSIKCLYCEEFIPRRKPSEQGLFCNRKCYTAYRKGTLRGAYNDGIVIISGYQYRYDPNHIWANKKGYIAIHRLVAEKKLGRSLLANEVVHHINEDKLDNRSENIQILSPSEHGRMHTKGRKAPTLSGSIYKKVAALCKKYMIVRCNNAQKQDSSKFNRVKRYWITHNLTGDQLDLMVNGKTIYHRVKSGRGHTTRAYKAILILATIHDHQTENK